jgi:hypothetical protein
VQQSNGRRVLHCESTWQGFSTLSSDLVDLLITEHDEDPMRQTALESLYPVEHNPFFTFPITLLNGWGEGEESETELSLDLNMDSFTELGTHSAVEDGIGSSAELMVSLTNQIPHPLHVFPDATSTERLLFHHYVSHVAVIMMPYEHARNPWKLYYPAIAQGRNFPDQTALYHAVLSQAAFNISHLRAHDDAMSTAGSLHYAAAMRQIVFVIGDKVNDFGSLLASIMTLVFAEIYRGESQKWRHHLQGAWQLFNSFRACEPWKVTDFVCVSIQSLNIISIISETSDIMGSRGAGGKVSYNEGSGALDAILPTFDFGFTIGASPGILRCIARINEFRKAGELFCDGNTELFLEETLSQLNVCLRETLDTAPQACQHPELNGEDEITTDLRSSYAQRVSFVYATYIYLYRTVLNVPPQTVKNYVSKIFDNISTFYVCSQGNFSIWPAFMAAVEAVKDADITTAREWLAWATSFGLGNRASVRKIIEEVWERRESQSRLSGISRGMVSIEWRDVMQELNYDVLLV